MSGPAADAPALPAARDNLVLITVDTLRADHLGMYGYVRDTSPQLDELARRGVLFRQALVQWPKTGPSISSILSSTYGSTSGVMRRTGWHPVPEAFDLLPETLQAAGYTTLAVVTNGSLSRALRYDQGFDQYLECFERGHAEAIVQGAQDLLQAADAGGGGAPFFLWMHFGEPHGPYGAPHRFVRPYLEDDVYRADQRPPVPLHPSIGDPSADPRRYLPGAIPKSSYLEGLDEVRDYVARYDASITYLDAALGQFLKWLHQEGMLERSLVAFTADHGESLGEHGYFFQHGRMPYDACTQVPLFLWHRDLAPRQVDAPVRLLDLAPSLLSFVGLEPGWQTEGQSWWDWLERGAPEAEAPPVFTESGYAERFTVAVRVGRHKLIRVADENLARLLTGAAYELYDLDQDPGETQNLLEERPEVFAELRALLDPYVERAYQKSPQGDGVGAVLPEAARRSLEALGYLEGH